MAGQPNEQVGWRSKLLSGVGGHVMRLLDIVRDRIGAFLGRLSRTARKRKPDRTTEFRPDIASETPARRRSPALWTVVNSDTRRKSWCGPTAVSALIGVDAAAVRDHVKWQRGGGAVKGTSAAELQRVLRDYGYDMTLVADLRHDPPTLATWERSRPENDDTAYLVIVTDHWIAVRGRWLCDTFTKGTPVPLRKAPHRRKRTRLVYKITVAASAARAA